MITSGRIIELIAERPREEKITDFTTDVSFDKLEVNGQDISISYTYLINYNDGSSFIRMKGQLHGKEDKKVAEDLKEQYEKTKQIPTDYIKPILDSLNAEGIYNSTLVSRLVGLPAPLKIPRISFENEGPKKKSKQVDL
ncbi:MAG TPA: hypothetical protein VI912_03675 [Candidatus Bilamarchaeaceae archaeon]|nr:hypothetical protein [Candidatus Bilamarchaeaceae archaeon]